MCYFSGWVYFECGPFPVTVTTSIVTSLVTNPYLNLHFPRLHPGRGSPTPEGMFVFFVHHWLPISFPPCDKRLHYLQLHQLLVPQTCAVGRPTETRGAAWSSRIPLSSLPWTTHDPGFETLHEPRPSKLGALGTLKTVTSLATQNANWIEDDMMLYIGPKPQNTGENDEV